MMLALMLLLFLLFLFFLSWYLLPCPKLLLHFTTIQLSFTLFALGQEIDTDKVDKERVDKTHFWLVGRNGKERRKKIYFDGTQMGKKKRQA